jgi:3-oxoacyl-[acyl-carrier protein] reductase
MNINFKNKNILITGVGRGLGLNLLERYLSEGANIIAIDNNKHYLEKIRKKYKDKINKKICLYNVDLNSSNKIIRFSNVFKKKFSKINSLVFCASSRSKQKDILKNWNDILNVSLKAQMLFIENLKSLIIKSRSTIVSIGSTNSSFISEQPLPYHVAKAGLNQLSKYYANTLGKYNVRVNVVEPGLVDNKMIKKKYVKSNKILIPLQKAATYDEICDLVFYLTSENSSQITGEIIRIDGGITTHDHAKLINK